MGAGKQSSWSGFQVVAGLGGTAFELAFSREQFTDAVFQFEGFASGRGDGALQGCEFGAQLIAPGFERGSLIGNGWHVVPGRKCPGVRRRSQAQGARRS